VLGDYLADLQLLEQRGMCSGQLLTGWDLAQHRDRSPHLVIMSMPGICAGRFVSDEPGKARLDCCSQVLRQHCHDHWPAWDSL
jgi:hypothetical protein